MFDRFFRASGRPFARRPDVEVDDELAFHMEQRVRDYIARGMEPDAARAAAYERFGDVDGVRRECTTMLEDDRRAESRRDWLADLSQDLRFGVRAALRAPVFSVLAVMTLALGIGANAAVFGVVKSVLLDTLPYSNADQLVRLYSRLQDGSLERSAMSAGATKNIAQRQRSFSRLAAFYHSTTDVTYEAATGPRVFTAALVGRGFFETLGATPLLGRALTEADTRTGAPNVVMLSWSAWQREFAGVNAIVGKHVRIDGESYEIIGVLRKGFVGPIGAADLWFPLDVGPALRHPVRARKQHWLGMVARLAPSIAATTARTELIAIGTALANEYPESDAGITFTAVPLRDDMVGETRTPLLVLMASAVFVLAIACANLAGALLSRMLTRRKEFAVRIALGAGRGRLVRQLLTESLVLAGVGGVAGLALAMAALASLRKLALSALPAYAQLSLDFGAVAVTASLAVATGLAFGLVPAQSVGRSSSQGTLRDEARGATETPRTRRLRGLLVAGQIALCLSLVAGSGLLVRSLFAMIRAPLGFDPTNVLTIGVDLPGRAYTSVESRNQLFDRFDQRLRGLPGVRGVASTGELPTPNVNRNGLTIEGVTWPSDAGQPFIAYATVSDDYFRVMRIPLVRGRAFGPSDRVETQPAVVISEGMAKRYWPNRDPIGARVRLGPNANAPWAQVVGIVGDVRNDPARPEPEPFAYGSSRQETFGSRVFVIRVDADPSGLVRFVQRELTVLDASLPVHDPAALSDVVAEGMSARRLPVVLMTAFGALALILASVGVYAMFASMGAAREREFGVRVALGSSRGSIAALVLRQGGVWLVLGLLGGSAGVALVARALGGLLYGVGRFDPVALGVAAGTLIVCALVALLVPVWRATRVDPISVLR